jgi:hypothetical protein
MRCRLVMLLVLFIAVPVIGAAQGPTKKRVPDWMAWEMFQRSLAFHQKQALSKPVSVAPAKRGLFSEKRLNSFELSMKRQFGLTPEEAAKLVAAGDAYLSALHAIDVEAKAEVQRRYRTLVSPTRPHLERKTTLERAKEDGLYAEVEGKKASALALHVRTVSGTLKPPALAKINQWIRESVAPLVTIYERPVRTPDSQRTARGAK